MLEIVVEYAVRIETLHIVAETILLSSMKMCQGQYVNIGYDHDIEEWSDMRGRHSMSHHIADDSRLKGKELFEFWFQITDNSITLTSNY